MLSKIVWIRILTLDQSPRIKAEMEKTRILNAPVFGKTVFGHSHLVFGDRTNVNMSFHSIFNNKQNDGCVVELIKI